MYFRAQQFYKINKMLQKAYNARVRRGENPEDLSIYKEINLEIVEIFCHEGFISHEMAEALGHKCDHEHGHEIEDEGV